jgi:hypothetical protein
MKFPMLFLVVMALLVTACGSSTAAVTPTPTQLTALPGPTDGSQQTPATNAGADWNKYVAPAGFSIQYPPSWQEQDLPDENSGQMHHIQVTGPEGGVEVIWGTGLGGACPQGYEPLTVAQGTWQACHSQKDDGTEVWSLAGQNEGGKDFAGFVYTSDTTPESKALVLKVLSTLSFP